MFLVKLDLGICKAILRDIGMQFRQLVNQEIEAQKWGGKKGMQCVKSPYSEFFWSVFSHIWTEYGDLLRKSPYSVRIWGNTDQKDSEYGHFLHSDDV